MEEAKNFELHEQQTTIVSLTGDTALVLVTGHNTHPNEGPDANYAFSSVSTSLYSHELTKLKL